MTPSIDSIQCCCIEVVAENCHCYSTKILPPTLYFAEILIFSNLIVILLSTSFTLQTLMSVLQILTAVLKFVQTLLGAIPAPAIQDITWQIMDKHVMVSPIFAYYY